MLRVRTAVTLALFPIISACGTTVGLSQSERGSQAGLVGPGSYASSTDDTSGPVARTENSSLNLSGSTPEGPSEASQTSADANATPDSGASSSASTSVSQTTAIRSRGVTPTTITLGIALPTGADAVASAYGVSDSTSADPQAVFEAVINDINKRGGVLGRKLLLYVHRFDAATYLSNPDQTYSTLCADFRDDHKVFAVMFDIPAPTVRNCLADMGSPLIVLGGFNFTQESAYREHGGNFLYAPNSISTELSSRLFIDSLAVRNFFQKWNITEGNAGGTQPTRLGLIHIDNPDQNALYAAYAKELKKLGYTFTDTVVYAPDAGSALAATQNAVLKFHTDGITHVFGASSFFLREADNQKYYPRYAYLPGFGTVGVDNSPAKAMNGALTVGWTPTTDVSTAQDPGENGSAKQCKAIMKSAGFDTTNRADLGGMYATCDALYSMRAALTAGKTPTISALRSGFDTLGTNFKPAFSFSSSFGPNRHFGVHSVRDMAFDAQCGCLKYTSTTDRR